ncbi:hypothetical protein [Solemya pervernicosa gill symbiont]|uniref:hypothetical protein n=1 Tax=Solemya pervernicosa gill symbiont TaxID=642797 RepID=UPI0009979429|nr:hypothetical protein [Solemya pervernicosa gill symbiont]
MSEKNFQRFSDRYFRVSPLYALPGWYLKLRGRGKIMGPYPTRQHAEVAGEYYVKDCKTSGDIGGRCR